ncbi:MAG TPA: membrane protein insertase YidC [bacterium]|nr:membrane protein insertase YidC [bacterium]
MKITSQQRMILALFVAAAVMFIYSTFFAKKPEKEKAAPPPVAGETAETAAPATAETAAPATAETAATVTAETAGPATAAPEAAAPETKPPAKTPARVKTGARAVVTTPLYVATFEDAGLVALELAQYPPDDDNLLFSRLGQAPAPAYTPLVPAGENARWEVDKGELKIGAAGTGKLAYSLVEEGRTLARVAYDFRGDDFEVAAHVVAGDAARPVTLSLGSFTRAEDDSKETGELSVDALVGADKVRDKLSGKDEVKNYAGDIPWAALRSKYFIVAAVAPQGGAVEVTRVKNDTLAATYTLKSGGDYKLYFGPKRYDRLKEFGVGLERTVDLGWSIIGVIAALMLRLMHFINKGIHNYGVTIIVFSALIKVLTYWPSGLSLKSSQRMQEIQPILKNIKNQYKDDPQRMNAETMALYKKYKINPLGGCLPMLLQIPIFWGMFNALRNAIELKGAPFMLWINDLSQPDVLFEFPFTIPLVNIHSLNVLPILMTAIWFLQNKFTMPGKGGVKSEQQKLMAFMPIIFGFLFYNWPSGLVLYWTANQLFTMGQMLLMRKSMKPLEADN